MNALDRGRGIARSIVVLAVAGASMPALAPAQGILGRGAAKPAPAAPTTPAALPKAAGAEAEAHGLVEVAVPANPSDPIAIVNKEVITRDRLASECVARKGEEILETLISKTLIDQALRAQKMEITAAEIDSEIDSIAMKMAGVTRDVWLRTLDKERGISPAQYARDIIYPALALRKLSEKRVQVTEQDLKDAFEANFGPRLRCRIIMTNDMTKAKDIWEAVRKNPGGFENIAKERSMDTSTRAVGGMLPEPMARHAQPRHVSDRAFEQLVDGDPNDKNPAHKPKDGDFTGPIQVNDAGWVIVQRVGVDGGNTGKTLAEPDVRAMLTAQMNEVKLKEKMGEVFQELIAAAHIDNKLTGQVKLAHEENEPGFREGMDRNVKLMNAAGETKAVPPSGAKAVTPAATSPNGTSRPPAGVPADAAKAAAVLQNAIKAAPPGTPAARR
ncbi:peptidylprolyl isomerase [Tundrisphaera sp. TA3]|uniref:peptidylprolyl isomerase n=1 Tax=Tundrisphaera sp. TA3 TaxID=3435775 RepID=UPI003EC0F218